MTKLATLIKRAIREAEIDVRKEYFQNKLVDKLEKKFPKLYTNHENYLHVVSKSDIDFKPPQDQDLPLALEADRQNAEREINQQIQKIFGKAPDTTIYLICDRIMRIHGFYL